MANRGADSTRTGPSRRFVALAPSLGRSFETYASRTSGRFRSSAIIVLAVVLALVSGTCTSLIFGMSRAAPTTWTVMVYLDGDNDLEEYAVDDFLDISSVGSTSQVNILVQFDRITGIDQRYGDWTTAYRYRVTAGMTPTGVNATADLGEVNMADQSTLVGFVDWAVANYPSDRYVLVLWDHGDNFYGVCWDDSSPGDDRLDLPEIHGALSQIYNDNGGLTLDVIGFDSCFGATAEMAYQVNPDGIYQNADYMVASESYEWDDGWNYSGCLGALVENPEMTVLEFCGEIVEAHQSYYSSLLGTSNEEALNWTYTLSVIDLLTFTPVVSSIDKLADDLMTNMTKWVNHIALARELCEEYGQVPWNRTVDVFDFAEKLYQVLPDSQIRSDIMSLKAAINETIVNETHGMNPANRTLVAENASGLSIYFPWSPLFYDDYYNADPDFKFAATTSWDEFLRAYYLEDTQHNPTVMTASPANDSVNLDSIIEIWFSEPMDYDSLASAFSISPNLDGTLVWIPAENKLEFHPDGELAPSTEYVVTISTDAMDLTGKHLKNPYQWQFTTEGVIIPEFDAVAIPAISFVALFVIISARRRRTTG